MSGADADDDSSERFEALLAGRPRRRLRRGAVVYREGDPPDEVSFVHDGLVKLVTTGVEGGSALLAFRGAGELLGEHPVFDGGPRSAAAVVVVDTVATTIGRDDLLAAVARDPQLAVHLLSTFAGHLRASTRHVLDLTSGPSSLLVARRLCELVSHDRFAPIRAGDGIAVSIDMPISHDELARWAGVSPRSAAAALQRLREAGVISTGRMTLCVHDVHLLERWARGDRPAPAAAAARSDIRLVW